MRGNEVPRTSGGGEDGSIAFAGDAADATSSATTATAMETKKHDVGPGGGDGNGAESSTSKPSSTSASVVSRCTGCKRTFPSKNRLFKHLRTSARTCLPLEEYASYVEHCGSDARGKVAVLYGYLPGADYDGATDEEDRDGYREKDERVGVGGGGHAAGLVARAVEAVDARRVDGGATASGLGGIGSGTVNGNRMNRSYGNVSRGCRAAEQDAHTGAITEVMCVKALPLDVEDGGGAGGKEALKRKTEEWVASVNRELEEVILSMSVMRRRKQTRGCAVDGGDGSDGSNAFADLDGDRGQKCDEESLIGRWSPGKLRVFGRISVPKAHQKFNAETDTVHRRVDYVLPAELLYSPRPVTVDDQSGSDNGSRGGGRGEGGGGSGKFSRKIPTTAHCATLQDFLDSLTSFRPGLNATTFGQVGDELKSGSDGVGDGDPRKGVNGAVSFPSVVDSTRTYLYRLKKVMQSLTTHIVELDATDGAAVMEKEFHDKKRKKQKGQWTGGNDDGSGCNGNGNGRRKKEERNKRGRRTDPSSVAANGASGSWSGGGSTTVNEKDGATAGGNVGGGDAAATAQTSANDVAAKTTAAVAILTKKRRVLRRKRYHNFCPDILAHDFLAYRRMDRFYHRATLRLDGSNDDPDSCRNDGVDDGAVRGRPFLVFSLTGDSFLRGQALRVVGLFLAICRGEIPPDIVDCIFDEGYTDLVVTPPAPHFGLLAGEATYMTWEGRLGAILSSRRCDRYDAGWNDESVVRSVEQWEESLLEGAAAAWCRGGASPTDGRLVSCTRWVEDVLNPWSKQTTLQLNDYRRWRAAKDRADDASDVAVKTVAESLLPPLESIDASIPPVFAEVLRRLREANASELWPTTTPKRHLVMVSTSSKETSAGGSEVQSLSMAHSAAKSNKDTRTSAYAYAEGEGGASGSFSVGAMPGELCSQPKGNTLFPELCKAAFELELALCPYREPSSTIAINRNAQFRPHKDNGAGAGQSNSLIVGLGGYVGGDLVVEGERKDIRYKAVQFDGWKERHWTLPFGGERYSLVWFTPKGCEGVRGIDLTFDGAKKEIET